MNTEIWYEEELLPPTELAENMAKSLQALEAKPALKVEKVLEASLGSVSTDLHRGQVTPVTLGFFGEEERKP